MAARSYFINSRALLHIALEARDASAGSAGQAIVAITFSAIGLEAFVNEIIERVSADVPDGERQAEVARLRGMIEACDLAARTTGLATKVQVIRAALTGSPFPRGEQPYQDFDLLLAVRNFVVHDRPELVATNDAGGRAGAPVRVVQRLVARQVITSPEESEIVYGAWSSLADQRVAFWAFSTAVGIAQSLAQAFPGRSWATRLLHGFAALTEAAEHR
jgi:hypothetical protein